MSSKLHEGTPPNDSIAENNILKYRDTRKKRSLKGKNIEHKKLMDSYVDEMIKFKAANSYHTSIKLRLSGSKSGVKAFFEKTLETNDNGAIILDAPTNYGTATLQKNKNMNGASQIMIKEALEKMNIDIDKFITSKEFMKKHKLIVNTDELKCTTEFDEKTKEYTTRFERCKQECEIFEDDEMSDEMIRIIKLIAATKHLMGELQVDARQYNIYYNLLKEKFKKESTKGTFPRNYEYKGITLNWNCINIASGLYGHIKDHFMCKDFENETNLLDEFNNQMNKLRREQKKYKMNIFIDNEEYEV